MLYLISLGLYDEFDLSLRGLKIAKKCDELFVEFYTTKMETNTKRLSKLVGKPVKELQRADMEENSGAILKKTKNKKIGIFVGGDALTATTHIGLLLDARNLGIKYEVIHGASIYTAVAETGLQIYKFGKTTTLPLQHDFLPESCYKTIWENKKLGLHTLVLLDVKSNAKKWMTIAEGLKTLLDLEKKIKCSPLFELTASSKSGRAKPHEKLISPDLNIVACCRLGGKKIIKYGKIKDLILEKKLNKVPAVLIIPGKLHFMEKEFLEGFG